MDGWNGGRMCFRQCKKLVDEVVEPRDGNEGSHEPGKV